MEGREWSPGPRFRSHWLESADHEAFMLTTVELSSSQSVRILVGFRLSGSGTKHGAYESNA